LEQQGAGKGESEAYPLSMSAISFDGLHVTMPVHHQR
jgi:hypothetical protein